MQNMYALLTVVSSLKVSQVSESAERRLLSDADNGVALLEKLSHSKEFDMN